MLRIDILLAVFCTLPGIDGRCQSNPCVYLHARPSQCYRRFIPAMSFLALSNEILLSIAEWGHDWDTASLSQVNRHLYVLLTSYLYKKDARDYLHPILTRAVEKGNPYTVRKWLREISTTNLPGGQDAYHAMDNAAKNGHEDVVRVFLEGGVGPNRPYKYGDPLFYAICIGHLSLARMLLAHGAKLRQGGFAVLCEAVHSKEPLAMVRLLVKEGNCNPRHNRHSGALSEAARKGKVEVVRYLLLKGCDVEAPGASDYETPICLAAENGHLETVRVLIKYGANVNPVLQTGQVMYPLRLAMGRYHLETAICLLAEMDLVPLIKDPTQQGLLLCVAAACGLQDLAKLLLKCGCDPEAVLVDAGDIGLRLDDDEQMTACVWAAAFGHMDIIELLLNHDVDLDYPLLIAVERGQLHAVEMMLREFGENCCAQLLYSAVDHAAVFRLLLEHGVDFEDEEEERHFFVTAIQYGQVATVRVLVDFGFTIKDITTPTFTASTGGIHMLEFLLHQKIIPPPSQDSDGNKAVHHAVHQEDIALLKLLHHHRCPIDPNDYPKYLEVAIYADSAEVFESMLDALLSYGVDINARGPWGQGCFWSAIRGRKSSRLEVLLEKGADPLVQDDDNETPFMFASRANFPEGIEVLLPAITSRVLPEELVRQIKEGLEVARSNESVRSIRALERIYYCELPGNV